MGERICSFDGLDLRDEQLDILNAVRDFVDNEIIPVAHDLEARDEYPEEIVQGLREMGLFGMRIPEEYGGLGLDLTTYALAIAELSRGWMSVAGIVNGVYIVSGMLAGHGTQEQKERYLPKLAAGELICCFMMTEPEAGSDVRAIRTTARREGDELVAQRPEDVGHERLPRRSHGRAREDRPDGRSAAGRHDGADRREGAGRRRAGRHHDPADRAPEARLQGRRVDRGRVRRPPRARLDDPRRARRARARASTR